MSVVISGRAAGVEQPELGVTILIFQNRQHCIPIDGGLVQQFETTVDDDGEVTFEVGPDTIKGLYRFRASSIAGQSEWIQANETLRMN